MLIEGHKYKIVKPKNWDEPPFWRETMDYLDETVVEFPKNIKRSYADTVYSVDSWNIGEQWLQPIDDKPILTFVLSLCKK